LDTYGDSIDEEAFAFSFLDAIVWTLRFNRDTGRERDVLIDLQTFGLEELGELIKEIRSVRDERELIARFAPVVEFSSFTRQLRAAITIYYQRYHFILSLIEEDNRARLQEELPFMQEDTRLIAPMPGVGIFLGLIKGCFTSQKIIPYALELWKKHPHTTCNADNMQKYVDNFRFLMDYFSASPLKVAVVTSSIYYEANIVMREVFRILHEEVQEYPASIAEKEALKDAFADYKGYYDGFITATDSSEIRLKPHRDLYCLALHELGVERENFDKVVGFEDSESGLTAIRAAGIPVSIAVPFYGTEGHDMQTASEILPGGLLQAIFEYKLFLD